MRHSDRTSIGGGRYNFETTHWSVIQDARTQDDSRQRTVIDGLIRKYWKPIYCYLRRKGYNNETAKDLTQGFFHEIVLGKRLLQQADEGRGRFRAFLLTALNHYVTSVHRANVAGKRHPKAGIMSLEGFDGESVHLKARDMRPEDAYIYMWASVLMDSVLADVKESCTRDGKEIYWKVFSGRVLEPITAGVNPIAVTDLCSQYSIETKDKVSNMVVTVKRRLQVAMANRVRQHVASEEEVEQEIQDLMTILSR